MSAVTTQRKHDLLKNLLFCLKAPRIRSPEQVCVCETHAGFYNLILSAGCCVDGNERTADQTAGSQKTARERVEMWVQMEGRESVR